MFQKYFYNIKNKITEVISKFFPYLIERIKYDVRLSIIICGSIVLAIFGLFNSFDLFVYLIVFGLIFTTARLYKLDSSIRVMRDELASYIDQIELQKKVINEHLKEGGEISLDDRFFLETVNQQLNEHLALLDSLPKIRLF